MGRTSLGKRSYLTAAVDMTRDAAGRINIAPARETVPKYSTRSWLRRTITNQTHKHPRGCPLVAADILALAESQ
jgi:hypothetical protein